MEIIHSSLDNIKKATNLLVTSLTRCKFEATDSVNDELVLYSILKLLLKISKKLYSQLSDSNICEMIEVALGMYFQSRISEFLRSGALETLVCLTRLVFLRLGELDFKVLESSQTASFPQTETETQTLPQTETAFLSSPQSQTQAETESEGSGAGFGYKSVVELLRVIASLLDPSNKRHIDSVHRHLGLILLSVALETGGKELCTFITWALSKVQVKHERFSRKKSLIDLHMPSNTSQNTVSVADSDHPHQMVGLKMENEGDMENNGSKIESEATLRNPEELVKIGIMAKGLIANDICKSIFQVKTFEINDQLIQAYDLSYNSPPSWPIISLIHQSLRALGLLFKTLRLHLKYQLDWFLSWCMNIVDAGLVAWNIEDWMSPVGSDNSRTNSEKTMSPKREEILIGEIREMILSTIYLVFTFEINYSWDMIAILS